MAWYAVSYTPERIHELVGPMAECDARVTAGRLRDAHGTGKTPRRFGFVECATDGSIDRTKITEVPEPSDELEEPTEDPRSEMSPAEWAGEEPSDEESP